MEIKEKLSSGGEFVIDDYDWNIQYYFQGPDLRFKGKWVYIKGNDIDDWIYSWRVNFNRFQEIKSTFGTSARFEEIGERDMYITERGVSLVGGDNYYRLPNNGQPINTIEKLDVLIDDYKYCKKKARKLSIKMKAFANGVSLNEEEIEKIVIQEDNALRSFHEDKNNAPRSFKEDYQKFKKNKGNIGSFYWAFNKHYSGLSGFLWCVGMGIIVVLILLGMFQGCKTADRLSSHAYGSGVDLGMYWGYVIEFWIYYPLTVILTLCGIASVYTLNRDYSNRWLIIIISVWIIVHSIIFCISTFDFTYENNFVDALKAFYPIISNDKIVKTSLFYVYDITEYMVYVFIPFTWLISHEPAFLKPKRKY